jgi:uncharacterized protein (TIGR00299 family) protein
MKPNILYLDCFSGISGDMFLGALLDLGVPLSVLKNGLAALALPDDYVLQAERVTRSGILGTSFQVHLGHASGLPHDSHAHAGHHGRTCREICQMITAADLPSPVRERALAVFQEIGQAEADVHGVKLDDVHFHEVGAVDSIVDIVGAALALDYLQIDRIAASPLADGAGFVDCQHGRMPVPVPAVLKMLENTDIPYRTGTSDTELVTPTGMGLIKTLAHSFGPLPRMRIVASGYGFGQREIGRLNALRAILGEAPAAEADNYSILSAADAVARQAASADEMDQVVLLSCQIDNTTPEQLGYATHLLGEAGCLDVTLSPLLMKKNRPGQLLTVLVRPDQETAAVRLIFRHTGTIGIRRQTVDRHVMTRSISTVDVAGRTVRFKEVCWQDVRRSYPEYEDLAALAREQSVSLGEAEAMARQALANGGPERRPDLV